MLALYKVLPRLTEHNAIDIADRCSWTKRVCVQGAVFEDSLNSALSKTSSTELVKGLLDDSISVVFRRKQRGSAFEVFVDRQASCSVEVWTRKKVRSYTALPWVSGPKFCLRKGFFWFPSAHPFVLRGAKIAFFLNGRFLKNFGRLQLRRCISLRFHVFFWAPARPFRRPRVDGN